MGMVPIIGVKAERVGFDDAGGLRDGFFALRLSVWREFGT